METQTAPKMTLADHLGHVQKFLSEMYAIMVDPLADEPISVADTCALLLRRAREDRDLLVNPVLNASDAAIRAEATKRNLFGRRKAEGVPRCECGEQTLMGGEKRTW